MRSRPRWPDSHQTLSGKPGTIQACSTGHAKELLDPASDYQLSGASVLISNRHKLKRCLDIAFMMWNMPPPLTP
jgi:hypothetical protein